MNFGYYKLISPHRFPVQLYYCEYCNLNETIFINIVDSIYLIEGSFMGNHSGKYDGILQ